MSAGRMRPTVEANIREMRRQDARQPARSAEGAIRAEMAMASGEAILRGMAELMDRDMPSACVGPAVTQAQANGMASFVMAVAQGDPVIGDRLIPGLVRHFELGLRGRYNDPVGAVVPPTGRPT